MRQRRPVFVIAALAAIIGTGLAACANRTGSQAGAAASGSASTASSPVASAAPAGSAACSNPRTAVTVTEADNGSTVCLAMGGTLTVTLHNAAGAQWQEVQAQGDALRTIVGRGTLPVGVTGGFYSGARAGTATVDSSRSNCPPASGGAISCHSLQSFQINVQVS